MTESAAPSTPGAHAAEAGDPARAADVFYDGGCPVCRKEISFYQRIASDDLAFRDLTDAEAAREAQAASGLGTDALMARFHVRRADGTIASGFAAFLAVWRATPRLAWLGRALDRQPFLFLGERAYRLFLALRPLWRRRA